MLYTPKFSTVIFLFIFHFLITEAIVVKRENSLMGPYEGAENLVYWDLTGSAQLGQTFIRLTTDEPDKQGAIWNNFPVLNSDWEFQVQFHIHGKGVYLNGEGMALWYAKDPLHLGPVFGYKDYFDGLGIFIDTYQNEATPHNHRHPYISAVVNNGSIPYKHDEDGTQGQIGGCHVPIRNLENPTKIAVSYMSNILTVFLDTEGRAQWKPCFRALGVYLPTGYYYGISASTNELSDNHDVISVTTLNLESADKEWEDKSDVIPFAENIQVPIKDTGKPQQAAQPKKVEEKQQQQKKAQEKKEQQKMEQKRETQDDSPPQPEKEKEVHEEDIATAAPVSFMRKAIYMTGIAVILLIAISIYKKYSAQRRERMQKRLF